MKILYAIQGTGNGHISRAKEILKQLDRYCHFDVLISGKQHETDPGCEVKYKLRGLTMVYNSKGSVSFSKSLQANDFRNFIREVKELPVEEYDLIINDFEPVSAWAARLKKVPCIALSHQASLLSLQVPKVKGLLHPAKLLLRYYAPSKRQYGFHFKRYNECIFAPIIRSEIKELEPEELGFSLVYLPAFSASKLLQFFRKFEDNKFELFVKNLEEVRIAGNCTFYPIGHSAFEQRLSKSSGVICSAGFELPSEVLYLNKKLLVIPIQNQYEQACNGKALRELGVTVIRQLKEHQIKHWLRYGEPAPYFYHEQLETVLNKVFEDFISNDLSVRDLRMSNYEIQTPKTA